MNMIGMLGWEGWNRADICVAREVNGRWVVLRLYQQRDYREWLGCFSII